MTAYPPLNQAQLATLAGVTPRRIRQLAQNREVPPITPAGYDLADVRLWLRARWERESASGDLTSEKARLTFHQANIAALAEAAKRQNLVPAEAVRAEWHRMRAAARSRLLRLVADLSTLHGLEPGAIEETARELVYEALRDLSGAPSPR